MNRRHFIHQTSRAAMMLPFLNASQTLAGGVRMGIVVHSYGLRWNSKVPSEKYPGFVDAIDLIQHCHDIGAGGVQVVTRGWSQDFVKRVRDKREKLGLYIEGSIGLPKNAGDMEIFQQDVRSAREAGARVIRTACLNGRRYETFHSLEAFEDFRKNSIASLELAERVVRKYRMKLAVENHKDWRASELAEILKNLGSEWVGVTIDFGNSIALMEDPLDVVNTLAPHIFSTHVKDMGMEEYAEGFLLSEVPLGDGLLDLKKMVNMCRENNPGVNFNLEMITRDPLKIPCLTDDYWSTFSTVTPEDLARTLRMVKNNTQGSPLPRISSLKPEEQLAVEEQNILESLNYSQSVLDMK